MAISLQLTGSAAQSGGEAANIKVPRMKVFRFTTLPSQQDYCQRCAMSIVQRRRCPLRTSPSGPFYKNMITPTLSRHCSPLLPLLLVWLRGAVLALAQAPGGPADALF